MFFLCYIAQSWPWSLVCFVCIFEQSILIWIFKKVTFDHFQFDLVDQFSKKILYLSLKKEVRAYIIASENINLKKHIKFQCLLFALLPNKSSMWGLILRNFYWKRNFWLFFSHLLQTKCQQRLLLSWQRIFILQQLWEDFEFICFLTGERIAQFLCLKTTL